MRFKILTWKLNAAKDANDAQSDFPLFDEDVSNELSRWGMQGWKIANVSISPVQGLMAVVVVSYLLTID